MVMVSDRPTAAFSTNTMDFLASSIAMMESQGRNISATEVQGNMTVKQRALFKERLAYYRQRYTQETLV
ncbi:glycogen synthase [Edwardsiella ictaluri]|nr:glycogen synthase [Edwardsiella ictaluri]ARD38457.1 glycogen synthase [Edwardsiella ictaluri]AVZ83799.1 glycogen synthase [Edwardsiella ictaluri]EKS7763589.1 glycogen synthase [Edwardsiella ictaluri]EKS7764915.1 glycogen synthase [Edwardsiella ictaluri]EKS7770962.1 glycogen synthase [Edwardsiella ictaluri]